MIKIDVISRGWTNTIITMQEALNRYVEENNITEEDIINLVPDRDNPRHELHIYYRKKEF